MQRSLEETRARRAAIKEQMDALPTSNKPRKELVTLNKKGRPVVRYQGSGNLIGGSALFKLVGGKYHDITVRSFAPFTDIVFPNGDRYTYSDEPISRRSKAHVYKWTGNEKP